MADEISDPEARGVAERAHKTLLRVGAEGQATAPKPASKTVHTPSLCVGRMVWHRLVAMILTAFCRACFLQWPLMCPRALQEVLAALKECIASHSKAVVSAEDMPMLEYVSAQAARLVDVKIFTPSEWSTKVRLSLCAAFHMFWVPNNAFPAPVLRHV